MVKALLFRRLMLCTRDDGKKEHFTKAGLKKIKKIKSRMNTGIKFPAEG